MLTPGHLVPRLLLVFLAAVAWSPTAQAETITAAGAASDTTSEAPADASEESTTDTTGTAPAVTTAKAPADTTSEAPADTTGPLLPFRVELTDGTSHEASQVGPWPGDFIFILGTDGRTLHVPSFKVRKIVDARGRKFTDRVLKEHKTIPKTPPSMPRGPEKPFNLTEPQLSGFVAQGGYFLRLDPHQPDDSGSMLQVDIGLLTRIGDRHGIGVTFFRSGSGDLQSSGLKVHGRSRVGADAVLDIAPGIIIGTTDEAKPPNSLPGFVTEASVTFHRWAAIAGQIEGRGHEIDGLKTTDWSWFLGPRISFDVLPRLAFHGTKKQTVEATAGATTSAPVEPDESPSSKKRVRNPLSGFKAEGSYVVRLGGSKTFYDQIQYNDHEDVDRGVFQTELGPMWRVGQKWGLGASVLLGGNRDLSLFGIKARARHMMGAKTYLDIAPGYVGETPTVTQYPESHGFLGEVSLIHGWIGATAQVQAGERKDAIGRSSSDHPQRHDLRGQLCRPASGGRAVSRGHRVL